MKKLLLLIISIVIGVLVYQKDDQIIIPSDAIRIRIIANSNSISDLYQKKILKEYLKEELYNIVKDIKDSKEANVIINNNIDYIKKLVSSKTDDYQVNYGLNYFPKKVYKGVLYPEGNYQSLVITLGSGLGDNWWCVLYPPICMIEDNNDTTDVEYRLLITKLLNN